MQKIFIIIALILAGGYVSAQNIPVGACGLLYSYDAAGNRIKQEYYCNNTAAPVPMRTTTKAEPEVDETSFAKVDVLYPNPTTGRFTIRFARELKDVQIVITDAKGQAIQQITGNGFTMEFDISNRANGIYYIVIRNGKDVVTKKVMKQ